MADPEPTRALYLEWLFGPSSPAELRRRGVEALVLLDPGAVAALRSEGRFGDAAGLLTPDAWRAADPAARLFHALGLAEGLAEAALEQAGPEALAARFELAAVVGTCEPRRAEGLEARMRAAMWRAPSSAPARLHAELLDGYLRTTGHAEGAPLAPWALQGLQDVLALLLDQARSPHIVGVSAHWRVLHAPGRGLGAAVAAALSALARDEARPKAVRELARRAGELELSRRPARGSP